MKNQMKNIQKLSSISMIGVLLSSANVYSAALGSSPGAASTLGMVVTATSLFKSAAEAISSPNGSNILMLNGEQVIKGDRQVGSGGILFENIIYVKGVKAGVFEITQRADGEVKLGVDANGAWNVLSILDSSIGMADITQEMLANITLSPGASHYGNVLTIK